ncbi:MAG: flagellin [Bryobacteraceae bacterium]
MISRLDSASEKFLADLGRLQERNQRAQRQITSGLRVSAASDDPGVVAAIVESQVQLDRVAQIRTNLERIQAETESGEEALATATSLVERVIEIASRGANSTNTAESRSTLAIEAESILNRLVTLSSARVGGRYIFSGDADQTAPYTVDLTQPSGVSAYAGAASTRRAEDIYGVRIALEHTAQTIFDNSSTSVFAAVNSLRTALLADDQPGIANALSALRSSHDHLNKELSFYGSVQNEIATSVELATKQELNLKVAISRLRDADLVESSVELAQTRTHIEAAFSSRASMPRTTLFDYLG